MNKKEKLGCLTLVLTILRLITTVPLYYILMYLILTHINATPTIWAIFWVYAPAAIAFALLAEILSQVMKGED